MLKLFLNIVFIFLVSYNSYSLKNNMEIIDSLAQLSAKNIIMQMKTNRADSIVLSIENHSSASIFETYLVNFGNNENIKFFQNQKEYPKLNLVIYDLHTEYLSNDANEDSLKRKIICKIGGTLHQNNQIKELKTNDLVYCDEISRDDVPFIETSKNDYARAPLPEVPKSFFREFAEPLIIVGTAAVTVLLLFTIRSN